jgi:hypothetical protein
VNDTVTVALKGGTKITRRFFLCPVCIPAFCRKWRKYFDFHFLNPFTNCHALIASFFL